MKQLLALTILAYGSLTLAAEKVFFVDLKDKATVGQELHIKMGIEGRTLCEAGKEPKDKLCGHHHIIVDGKFIPEGTVIPADEKHVHFGKAQTEAHLKLTPGKHTLTLQLADYAHRSYGEKLSQTISVEVK